MNFDTTSIDGNINSSAMLEISLRESALIFFDPAQFEVESQKFLDSPINNNKNIFMLQNEGIKPFDLSIDQMEKFMSQSGFDPANPFFS